MPKNKIGFMQGRLSRLTAKRIQSFPSRTWKSEFALGKKIGMDAIEWTIDYHNIYSNPLINNSIHKKYFKTLNISSVTCDFFMQRPFWKYNNYLKMKDIFVRLISSCGQNNINFIIVPLVDNSSIKENKIQNLVKVFFKNFEISLINNNVSILFESDFKPMELKKFIKSFSSKKFGINYDTGNSASLGLLPKEEIMTYRKLIKNVHIKDRMYKSNTVMLGDGDANLKEIINLLRKIKYDGLYILQTYRSSNNSLRDLKTNLEYFKQIIDEKY